MIVTGDRQQPEPRARSPDRLSLNLNAKKRIRADRVEFQSRHSPLMVDISLTSHHSFHPLACHLFLSDIKPKKNMKIKKEEIKEEGIKTEDIKKETIKKEDVEPSFRASLSHFAYPSSPPSARPPKRPSPDSDSNPNPSPSASLTVTVAVAQPAPDGRNNDGSVASDSQAVVQALRRSPRKRKGETRQSLDTGGGGDTASTRPSKRVRRGNPPRAPVVDLSHLGALPEHLAEDLDGTFHFTNPTHACCILVYIK